MQTTNTKLEIALAFERLSQTTPIDKLSVRGIADAAGVSTRTFYNHFTDKYDLMNWYICDIVERLFDDVWPSEGYREYLVRSIGAFAEHRDMQRNILRHVPFYESYVPKLVGRSVDLYLARSRTLSLGIAEEDLRTLLTIHFYGAVMTAIDWFNDGMRTAPEQLVDLLVDSVPQRLAGLLLG